MNLNKIVLSVLIAASLFTSLVASYNSLHSRTTDPTPEPVPTHSTNSPAPKATATPTKAPKAPKDQTTTANVPMTESVSAPPVQIIEPSPDTINPPVLPSVPTAPPLDTVTNQPVQSQTVQNRGKEESDQNGLITNEDTATTETEYLEAIFDENQSTHWENGGLVVSTLGDALAMCGDPRFGPESDFSDCVNASNEWAKDAGLDTDKVGPTTLPPAPAPVK